MSDGAGDGLWITGNPSAEEGFTVLEELQGDVTWIGSGGDDRIHSVDGNDVIDGREGDDEILLGYGTDEGYGGAGDDSVYGYEGDDLVDGGPGDDLLVGDWSSGPDAAADGQHPGDDWLMGQAGDDTLRGMDGKDQYWGGEGSDTFIIDAGSTHVIHDFDAQAGDVLDVSRVDMTSLRSFEDGMAWLTDGTRIILMDGSTWDLLRALLF